MFIEKLFLWRNPVLLRLLICDTKVIPNLFRDLISVFQQTPN